MNGSQEPDLQPYEVEQPPVVAPPPATVTKPGPTQTPDGARCRGCGYELRGLQVDRNCPECGMPIARSIAGNLLIYSSPEYLKSLHHGLVFAILASVLEGVLGLLVIPLAILSATGNLGEFSDENVDAAFKVVCLPVACMKFIGWWMFSTPDPAVTGDDKGDKPRRLLRLTLWGVLVYALADVSTVAVQGMAGITAAVVSLMVIAFIVQVVLFFATLRYISWMAPRLPNLELSQTCGTYRWLIPLIYVVGSCLIVGPFVALVMYLVLMNNIRLQLAAIRRRQRALFAGA